VLFGRGARLSKKPGFLRREEVREHGDGKGRVRDADLASEGN